MLGCAAWSIATSDSQEWRGLENKIVIINLILPMVYTDSDDGEYGVDSVDGVGAQMEVG
jgi:hypothetical protein